MSDSLHWSFFLRDTKLQNSLHEQPERSEGHKLLFGIRGLYYSVARTTIVCLFVSVQKRDPTVGTFPPSFAARLLLTCSRMNSKWELIRPPEVQNSRKDPCKCLFAVKSSSRPYAWDRWTESFCHTKVKISSLSRNSDTAWLFQLTAHGFGILVRPNEAFITRLTKFGGVCVCMCVWVGVGLWV